jgi:hypothetical protein
VLIASIGEPVSPLGGHAAAAETHLFELPQQVQPVAQGHGRSLSDSRPTQALETIAQASAPRTLALTLTAREGGVDWFMDGQNLPS